MDVSPDPQVIADQEAYSAGTRWCALVSYTDRSGTLGVYGPYRSKARANSHAKLLQEAGIFREELWEILPIRVVDLGRDAP
jgi:hypothetical protein